MNKQSTSTNSVKKEMKDFFVVFGIVSVCYMLVAFVFLLFKVACHLFTWSWDNFWTETNTMMLYWFLGMWIATLVFGILGYIAQGVRILYKKSGVLYRFGSWIGQRISKILNKVIPTLAALFFIGILINYIIGPAIYGWVSPFIHKEHPLDCPAGQQNVLYVYNPLFSEIDTTKVAYICCEVGDTKPVDFHTMLKEDKDGKSFKENGEWATQKFPIGADSSGRCCPAGTQGMRYMTREGKVYTTCCPEGTLPDTTGECCPSDMKALELPTMNNTLMPAICAPQDVKAVDSNGNFCRSGTHYVLYVKPQKEWSGLNVDWQASDALERYMKLRDSREQKYGKFFAGMLTLREAYDKQAERGWGEDNEPELSFACCTKEQTDADSQGNCCQATEHAVYYIRREKVYSKCCDKQFDFVDKKGNCAIIGK